MRAQARARAWGAWGAHGHGQRAGGVGDVDALEEVDEDALLPVHARKGLLVVRHLAQRAAGIGIGIADIGIGIENAAARGGAGRGGERRGGQADLTSR